MRSVASLPSLSPASFLTISYELTALPLAEPKLPLPPAALSTQMHIPHTHTHVTYTQSLKHHAQVYTCYTHIGSHRYTYTHHTQTQSQSCIHKFTPLHTHVCALSHILHIHRQTHKLTHTHIHNHTVVS